jgi:hypothetical protein
MAKAGDKFSRRRYWGATIGGRPLLFDADNSERASLLRLEAEVRRLQQELATPPPKRKQRKPQRKPAQEEILPKLREKYPPDGNVGNASTAKVRRTISGKGFNPGWDSVNRALGRAPKK